MTVRLALDRELATVKGPHTFACVTVRQALESELATVKVVYTFARLAVMKNRVLAANSKFFLELSPGGISAPRRNFT